MNNIEVEIRSFISKEKYEELIKFFDKNAEKLSDDYQETYYFDTPQDLRIQKNKYFSKVWLKKGKIHDESREEIEIKSKVEDFENLEKLFLALDYKVKIKWFRNRTEYRWQEMNVCIDYSKGYGYIVELEKMSSEKEKENSLEYLKNKLKELEIPLTSREEFERKFKDYEDNWQTLTQ